MEELTAQLLVYLKGVWKYRWVAVVAAWIVAMAGWTIVYKLPDDYQSTARIYVDTQNVLKPLMAGMTVSPDLQQQVSIMSRTLISRPNVERVIRMVDLDIKAKNVKEQESLIKDLMSKIQLGAAGRDNLFTIHYNNQNPKLAKDIVQSLLTIFVEGGLGDKTQDSSSAIRFIDEQIRSYEEKLIAGENNLKAFKQKNIGIMPQQGGDYYSQLSQSMEDLNKTRLELREAEQARDAIKRQITGDEPVLLVDQDNSISSIVNVELDSRIEALDKNLDALRLNFTELHPDIISTKRLIAQLEERKKEEAKLTRPSADPGKNYSPMLQQLNVALTEAEADVAAMNARVEEYTARYERLKSLSNAVPQVEAELAQLNRDYQVRSLEKLIDQGRVEKVMLAQASGPDIDLGLPGRGLKLGQVLDAAFKARAKAEEGSLIVHLRAPSGWTFDDYHPDDGHEWTPPRRASSPAQARSGDDHRHRRSRPLHPRPARRPGYHYIRGQSVRWCSRPWRRRGCWGRLGSRGGRRHRCRGRSRRWR